jgi:hypothetical protein
MYQLNVPSSGAYENLEVTAVQCDNVASLGRGQDYRGVDHI